MNLTKTKSHIKIAHSDWEKMKKNPALSETIELLEDISDLEKAKKLYEDLLTKYPGSLYTVEARKRFRKMRGDTLEPVDKRE